MENIFCIPGAVTATSPELEQRLLAGSGAMRVERILSMGHTTPEGFWYDQEEDEWVALLEGSARVLFANGTEVSLTRGETLFIPRRARHRVTYSSSPCIWLAIFAETLTPIP